MSVYRIALVLLVVLGTASVAVAGPALKADLTRPADASDDDAKGFLKVKAGKAELFEVKVAKLDREKSYDLFLETEAASGVFEDEPFGQIAGKGKWKVNTRRGDELPSGAESVDDLGGRRVEVRDGEDVVLAGTVPDPDASKVKGGAKDDLEAPDVEEPADPDAEGVVSTKITPGGTQLFSVLVKKVGPADYGVFMASPDADPVVFTKVGDISVPDGEDSGKWMVNSKRGDALPLDATTVADLDGYLVEVRDAEGNVVVEGTVPELEKKVKGPKKPK